MKKNLNNENKILAKTVQKCHFFQIRTPNCRSFRNWTSKFPSKHVELIELAVELIEQTCWAHRACGSAGPPGRAGACGGNPLYLHGEGVGPPARAKTGPPVCMGGGSAGARGGTGPPARAETGPQGRGGAGPSVRAGTPPRRHGGGGSAGARGNGSACVQGGADPPAREAGSVRRCARRLIRLCAGGRVRWGAQRRVRRRAQDLPAHVQGGGGYCQQYCEQYRNNTHEQWSIQ